MKTKTKTAGKLAAAGIALAAAVSIVCGGAVTASYADEHVHSFSDSWTIGYKNHYHACECGTVKDMKAHSYVNGVCGVCGAEQPDPAHTHTYNEAKWEYDSANHWHAASCGHNIVKDVTPHSTNEAGECVCGYVDVTKVPAEVPENISAAGGYNESMYAEWQSKNVNNVTAYYQEYGATGWIQVDAPLVRMKDDNTARVDVVGIKAGVYNLKIALNGNDTIVRNINVTAYDRSGYAHFNYNSGIGAYNDDGTLKDNALVIYVTNANKNDVSDYVYKNTANGLVKEDISQYIKPGVPQYNGKPLGGEGYASIGYILNNRGYNNNSEREQYGIQKLTFTYGGVSVRFLDTVTSEFNPDGSPTLTGLTYYAKAGGENPISGEKYEKGGWVPNGGTVNDNGQMARITNAKNLTIEGIGENAGLYGWGVHFVSNDNLHRHAGAGAGFEVRNLTFESYPEDAIGMEGTQGYTNKVDQTTGSITGGASSADAHLISPVERCWIHNNVFLPGFCENPAESDKKEGDGSCDFKRGQYYTLSYNYFENCHKTNLLGSADNSLTYNVTMHHNWWNQCGARQPLTRRANVHYYNNYISGATDYVSSLRANCLLFSEANYYDGCKNVTQKNDGEGVAWNNVYYACYNENQFTELTSRTQTVSNSCKFIGRNIDYSQFYVNSSLFYYNGLTQTSDCLLDTAVEARVKVMMNAGVNGFGKSESETQFNEYTPKSAVSVGAEGTVVNLTSVGKGSSTVSNVEFNGITGASGGTVKGKGQIITFTLASEAQLTVTTFTSGDPAPELVGADGTVYANKFTGTLTIVLQKGTYIICTGQKDKESVISELKFADTASSSAARIEAAVEAINALPATVTLEHAELVKAARVAYSGLTPSEKGNFSTELKAKLDNAVAAYNRAAADAVIALIGQIGEVDENSFDRIYAAQTAYNALTAEQKVMVSNASVLSKAQEDYSVYAVQNVINMINNLETVSEDLTDAGEVAALKAEYDKVKAAYDALDDGSEEDEINQQAQVTNISKLTGGLALLEKIQAELDRAEQEAAAVEQFRELLAAINTDNLSGYTYGELSEVVGKYEALGELKNNLTADEITKYNAVKAKCDELYAGLPREVIKVSATDNTSSSNVNIEGGLATVFSDKRFINYSGKSVTVDGNTFDYAIMGSSNGNPLSVKAGDKDVKIVLYITTVDSNFAGKTTTVTWSDADGAHTLTTDKDEAATTVYEIEINLEAGATCALTVSSNRLVFWGAVVTAY